MNHKPFIFMFESSAGHFFYDVNKNRIVEVNKDIYCQLSELCNNPNARLKDDCYAVIHELKQRGYLSSNHSTKIEHPLTPYVSAYLDNNIYALTLQITQNCNMHCRYCSFSGDGTYNRVHAKKSMDETTAKQSIDFLAKHGSNVSEVDIGFYGGEPMLEYELVRNIVRYSKGIMPDKAINFHMTTNGTIINSDIIKFLAENHFRLTISVDGPKDVHDKYRRFAANGLGTFDLIYDNLKRIRDQDSTFYKTIMINSVVDRDSEISDIESFFEKEDMFRDLSVLVNGVSDNYIDFNYVETKDYIVSMETALFKQMVEKLRGVTVRKNIPYFHNTKRFADDIYEMNPLPAKIHHQGPCIPGQGKLFVDINGKLRPCEKVSEKNSDFVIGDVFGNFDLSKVKTLINVGKLTESECLGCWAIRLCKQCALSADNTSSLSKDLKLLECKNQKYQLKQMLKDYVVFNKIGW